MAFLALRSHIIRPVYTSEGFLKTVDSIQNANLDNLFNLLTFKLKYAKKIYHIKPISLPWCFF